MASRFSIEAVISMIDHVSNPMKRAGKSVSGFSRSAQRHFKGVERSALSAGSVFKGIIGADILKRALYGLKSTAMEAIELGSALNEVQNVVHVTFQENEKAVNKWSKTAITQFGLSELQAKKFTSTLGSMAKSSGISGKELANMSMGIAGLAGDYASFRDMSPEEAFEKLKSVVTGETEPLRALGLNMTVANLQAFALTQGITKQWKSMNQAEQVMLRYNYIIKNTADAQGDFSRTLKDSYANQRRVFSTNLKQKLATIAAKILPMLVGGFRQMNRILNYIDAESVGNALKTAFSAVVTVLKIALKILVPVIKLIWKLRYVILAVAAAFVIWKTAIIGTFILQKLMMIMNVVKVLGFAGAIKYAALSTKGFASAQIGLNTAMLACPITWIIAAVLALVGAIWLLYKNWDVVTADFNRKITAVIIKFDRLKLKIYELLNTIGLMSKEKVLGVKLEYMENVLKLDQYQKQFESGMKRGMQWKPEFMQENSLINEISPYASPNSAGIAAGVKSGTKSTVDINVTGSKETAKVKQSGVMPDGTNLNLGLQ